VPRMWRDPLQNRWWRERGWERVET
jgi:hypothetical protein